MDNRYFILNFKLILTRCNSDTNNFYVIYVIMILSRLIIYVIISNNYFE